MYKRQIFGSLFALVAEIGLGSTLVQTKDITQERLGQIFGLIILTNGIACVVMAVVVAPIAAAFFDESRLELVIKVIALQFIPSALCLSLIHI